MLYSADRTCHGWNHGFCNTLTRLRGFGKDRQVLDQPVCFHFLSQTQGFTDVKVDTVILNGLGLITE